MWHAQAVEEAKAAKAAEKAEREARKAERQEELEKKIGSTKAFKPTTSAELRNFADSFSSDPCCSISTFLDLSTFVRAYDAFLAII